MSPAAARARRHGSSPTPSARSSARSRVGTPFEPVAGVDCAEALYAKAGITDPLHQIDCAELYVPFSWYEPMWLEGHLITPEGEGWKLTDAGETEIERRISR